MSKKDLIKIRKFKTGANRNNIDEKIDYEGFFSPIVIERFAQHMYENRMLENGEERDSDNWQLGIPKDVYIKSGFRHFIDWWKEHRGYKSREGLENALCSLIFNAQGYLYEILKDKELDEHK